MESEDGQVESEGGQVKSEGGQVAVESRGPGPKCNRRRQELTHA